MDIAGRELFEAALADDPEDLAAWQAYADWLCEQGHPHGELMQVQLRMEPDELAEAERKRLEQEFTTILRTHSAEILGPEFATTIEGFEIRRGVGGSVVLRARTPKPPEALGHMPEFTVPREIPRRPAAAVLYRGWLSRLWGDDEEPLPALLNAPAARLLQSLQAYLWEEPVALLRGRPFLPTLREFHCGELGADLAAVCRQMVRLEQLSCEGWDAHAQGVVAALPRIRALGIGGMTAGAAEFVPTAELRQVERLEWKGNSPPSAEALASPYLQNVRSLSLLFTQGRATVRAIRDSGLARQLEALEIVFGCFTTADSVAELARLTSDHPQLHLDLRGVTISPEAQAILRAASPATNIGLFPTLGHRD